MSEVSLKEIQEVLRDIDPEIEPVELYRNSEILRFMVEEDRDSYSPADLTGIGYNITEKDISGGLDYLEREDLVIREGDRFSPTLLLKGKLGFCLD